MICGISLAILLLFNAIVIMYSYTLRIASGHNEFGSHILLILRMCGFKDSKLI